MASCYFPGCENHANSREHIPPQSFFPDSKKVNLMTVKSCKVHNNDKNKDDIYALANICVNCITDGHSNASEVFESSVKPQLMRNNNSLFKKIFKDLAEQPQGYRFSVDSARLDSFFDCLTHGVLYKKTKKKINPDCYRVKHLYMNLGEQSVDDSHAYLKMMKGYWKTHLLNGGPIAEVLDFRVADAKGYSHEIYKVKIMGADFLNPTGRNEFQSSISVIHEFYGHFVVVSALTRVANFESTPVSIRPEFS